MHISELGTRIAHTAHNTVTAFNISTSTCLVCVCVCVCVCLCVCVCVCVSNGEFHFLCSGGTRIHVGVVCVAWIHQCV